ncbi:MAG: type I-E CRISPR-associated protein Cas5/CasD [Atopobiaceae bacterium]|nr:type I-E CRISPR-associated protein Cas5/CasD [Atopobiaceae bacterium]
MGILMLKLAGPLQSWGAESRFLERKTRHEPTKSGVVGLIASALGRRREEPIDDLATLPFAVRIDQAGRYERDYQTAHTRKYDQRSESWVFDKSLPLSNRYYLADAVFVAALEVPDVLLELYAEALLHPVFPLYLGRRSCSPSEKVLLGCHDGNDLLATLGCLEWQATRRGLIHGHASEEYVELEVVRDRIDSDGQAVLCDVVRDVPLSFSQEYRRYGLRAVVHDRVLVKNPHFQGNKAAPPSPHDPMALLEEVVSHVSD